MSSTELNNPRTFECYCPIPFAIVLKGTIQFVGRWSSQHFKKAATKVLETSDSILLTSGLQDIPVARPVVVMMKMMMVVMVMKIEDDCDDEECDDDHVVVVVVDVDDDDDDDDDDPVE